MRLRRLVPLVLALVTIAGCATRTRQVRTNALEYLYPAGAAAAPAGDVSLRLPVRVGVAFAPGGSALASGIDPAQQASLAERVAKAFRDRQGIASVDPIPASQLTPKGGFEDLDRIAKAFGVDLVALISYDQFQFSDTTRASWAYWTIVGAYVVKGEKNETRTVLNAVVYDVASRSLLFHAEGQSSIGGRTTPIDVDRKLRSASETGFDQATDDLIRKLDVAVDAFMKQARTGTVRGPGTPGVTIQDETGSGGAVGAFELLALGLLSAAGWAARRRS